MIILISSRKAVVILSFKLVCCVASHLWLVLSSILQVQVESYFIGQVWLLVRKHL